MVILMEILQIYENDKIDNETPSHQDLLPGLIKLYVSGEVIQVGTWWFWEITEFPSEARICPQTL